MNWTIRLVVLCLASALLVACGGDEEAVPNPLPVVEKSTVSYDTVWGVTIGKGVEDRFLDIQPSYAYQKIYVADTAGLVIAIDAENGNEVWRQKVENRISAGVSVSNKLVVVGTREGEVITLDADTGEQKWKTQLSSEIIARPAVDSGYVVVNTVDGNVVALNAENGERRWFYDRNIPSLTLRGTSSPVITRGAAVAGFANGKVGVFILDNGQLAWEKQVTPPSGRSDLERLVDVDAQPLVYGESVYAASYNGNLVSLEVQSGEASWSRELSTFRDMAVNDQVILVTHDNGYISALNRNNGVLLWTQKALFLRDVTTAAVYDNHIVVGDFSGYLHMLDRTSGKLVGQFNVNDEAEVADCYDSDDDCNFLNFDKASIVSAPLIAKDKLVVYTRKGQLLALKQKKK